MDNQSKGEERVLSLDDHPSIIDSHVIINSNDIDNIKNNTNNNSEYQEYPPSKDTLDNINTDRQDDIIFNNSYYAYKLPILLACLISLLTIGFIYSYSFYIHFITRGPSVMITNVSFEPKSKISMKNTVYIINVQIMTTPHDQDYYKDAIIELEYLFLDIIQGDATLIKMENICRNFVLTREKSWNLKDIKFETDRLDNIKLMARLKYKWHEKWWWIYVLQPYRQYTKSLN
jgi:hypothetical protein